MFAVVALDLEYKAFIIFLITLSINSSNKIHSLKRAYITYFKLNKVPTKVFIKYADFANIFLPKLATKFLKYIKINNYNMKYIDDLQPLYNVIYSLSLVKLEILKTYIKKNLANSFINLSKSLTKIPIFFNKKLDRSLRL